MAPVVHDLTPSDLDDLVVVPIGFLASPTAPPARSGVSRIAPSGLLVPIAIVLISLCTRVAQGQIREWSLTDGVLIERTTALIERYYAVTRPDSIRRRYVRTWGASLPYRLRGRLIGPDSVAALLSVSLGQLSLFPTDNIRIALGEDLYSELLASGKDAGEGVDQLQDRDDWDSRTFSISLERIEVAVLPDIRLLVAMGSPESHLDWWTDGTFRIGLAAEDWEFTPLLPQAWGRSAIGPLRERRLLPSYGAAGRIRAGHFDAWARSTQSGSYTPSDSGRFYHSIGGGATYGSSFATDFGVLQWRIGAQVEEFKPLVPDSIRPSNDDVVRRFSPRLLVTWGDFTGIGRIEIASEDLTLSLTSSIRLTRTLWINFRCTAIDLLRDRESFEHPFYLFVSPRLVID